MGSQAREALISRHLPQARALAHEHARRAPGWAEFEELHQVACLTLVECSHESVPPESFAARVGTRIEHALEEALASVHAENAVRDALCAAAGREGLEKLRDTVLALPARECAVIEEHYFHGRQLKHIAGDMRLSKGRISQIHQRALVRLREWMAAASQACPLIM